MPRRPPPIEFVLVDLPAAGSTARAEPAPAGAGGATSFRPARPGAPGDASATRAADDATLSDLAWADEAAAPGARTLDLRASPPATAISLKATPDPSPEARLRRLLDEDAARGRVASGLADPFFLDLGRALLGVWEPDKVVTGRGLSGYVAQLGAGLIDFAATYADQAGRYGKSGSPFAPGAVPGGIAGLAAVPEGITTSVSDQAAVGRALADQSRTRHAALLRVVQRADGRLVSVEVVRPSDDSSVDAQALRYLRQAADAIPAPTPGALAGRPTVASIWEFSLVVSISPPLPMIAVQFDEVLGLVDARVPLDRRLFKLVRLVAVE